MLKLGEKQTLTVVHRVDFGVYLAEDPKTRDRVLLPAAQVPEGIKTGDELEVFLYKDSSDRLIATTAEPFITLGKTAVLTVKSVGTIGAFLDWGLPKDLMLPFREQTRRVFEGEKVLVAMYIDKSERLCATMRVYQYLKVNAPYAIGDMVKARVYEIHKTYGVFVAVDDKYNALIPKKDAQGSFKIGRVMDLRVTDIKEDGKLTVTPKEKAYIALKKDGEAILDRIREKGYLPFDDRADPELINNEFGLSKAAFKRAVGHLLKEGLVKIENGGIYPR